MSCVCACCCALLLLKLWSTAHKTLPWHQLRSWFAIGACVGAAVLPPPMLIVPHHHQQQACCWSLRTTTVVAAAQVNPLMLDLTDLVGVLRAQHRPHGTWLPFVHLVATCRHPLVHLWLAGMPEGNMDIRDAAMAELVDQGAGQR